MTEEFDFIVSGKVQPMARPVTITEATGENSGQRFERYARQVSRCVQACSLCPRGQATQIINGDYRAPHRPPSLNHSRVALVKWEPQGSDFGKDGLFGDLIPVFQEAKLDFNSVYRTAMLKCFGSGPVREHSNGCPYFKLELEALSPALVIATESQVCIEAGHAWTPGQFNKCSFDSGLKFNLFSAETPDQLRVVLKLVKAAQTNSQVSSRLFA